MAKATLDEILAMVEDKKEHKKINDRHQSAYKTYKPKKTEIENVDDLKAEVENFIKAYHKKLDKTDMQDHDTIMRAHSFLVEYGRKLLGEDNAPEDEAVNAVLKAAKGGEIDDLYQTYKNSRRMEEIQNYSSAMLIKMVDPSDFGHHTALAEEYQKRHGALLSPEDRKELVKVKPEHMAYKFRQIIGRHGAAKSKVKQTYGK